MNANCTLEIPMLCIRYRNVLLFIFVFSFITVPGVMSAQRLSHNSAGKLTVFVETNDRSRAFYVIISLLQTGERERCAHFVTLLAAFVPTVATSGNVRRTKKANITYVRAYTWASSSFYK